MQNTVDRRFDRSRYNAVRMLDALSRELPDGAWLLSLSIGGRDVIMDGLAPSAAEIASNPRARSATLRAGIKLAA